MTSVASASHHTPEVAVTHDATHCANDVQTQSHHPKYQSTRQRAMNCMLTELQAYQQKNMSARQQYFAYKAQAWLNYALHQDSMNSRSPAGQQAAQAAETILITLKMVRNKISTLFKTYHQTLLSCAPIYGQP